MYRTKQLLMSINSTLKTEIERLAKRFVLNDENAIVIYDEDNNSDVIYVCKNSSSTTYHPFRIATALRMLKDKYSTEIFLYQVMCERELCESEYIIRINKGDIDYVYEDLINYIRDVYKKPQTKVESIVKDLVNWYVHKAEVLNRENRIIVTQCDPSLGEKIGIVVAYASSKGLTITKKNCSLICQLALSAFIGYYSSLEQYVKTELKSKAHDLLKIVIDEAVDIDAVIKKWYNEYFYANGTIFRE